MATDGDVLDAGDFDGAAVRIGPLVEHTPLRECAALSGGLISGVAAAVKARSPGTRVVGVEPLGANAMSHALRRDGPDPLPQHPHSIADGLTAPFAGRHTLAHVKAFVDDVVEIDEQPIVDAWWPLMEATKLLLEPSAVVGLAAILAGAVSYDEGSTIALVLSGGNTSPVNLRRLADPPSGS